MKTLLNYFAILFVCSFLALLIFSNTSPTKGEMIDFDKVKVTGNNSEEKKDSFTDYINQEFTNFKISLGDSEEKIKELYGVPIETGYYEGGRFFDYEEVTFMVNPDTEKVVAIVKKERKKEMYPHDVKTLLGEPDFEGMNDMDGFWLLSYTSSNKQLLFEFKSPDSAIEFIWYREKFK